MSTQRPLAPARLLLMFAIAGLTVYVAMNYLMLQETFQQFWERGPLRSTVYLGWMGCGFLVFFALTVTAGRLALWVLLPLVLVSLAANYTYVILAKTMLTVDLVEWLPHEMARLPSAWREFQQEILAAIARAAVVVTAFLLIRVAIRRHASFRSSLLDRKGSGIAAVALFLGYTGAGMLLQPPNSVAETNLYVFGVPALFSRPPDLRSVTVSPARSPLAEKIVLVVDESVNYDIYRKVLAEAVRRFPVRDFGEAASTANCSASSNALLRWGVEKARIGDAAYDPRTNPTIWGYARKAGFRTVLIDGQSEGAVHNYISTKEFALIDEFIPADSGLDSDYRIAGMLNERLQRPGREFIYVVKKGSHFPYEMNYPKGLVSPEATRGEKYAAAVSYSSRGYFERLRRDLPFGRIVFVYTSDHGQDLSARSGHCNPQPGSDEYSVPLAVITEVPEIRNMLDGARAMDNRATHLNIFSTVLYALGYARDWIEPTYGTTLAGPPGPYLTYVHRAWNVGADPKKRRTVQGSAIVETGDFPRRTP